jgi:hypothetical protein
MSVTSPLENLSGPGQPLRKEVPDAKEFAYVDERLLADLIVACKAVAAALDKLPAP